MADSKEDTFYGSPYWHSNPGNILWGLRRFMALVNYVSGPNTPAPFFTFLPKSDMDETWVGFHASWSTPKRLGDNYDHTLTIEYDRNSADESDGMDFLIFALNSTGEYDFYFQFCDKFLKNGFIDLEAKDNEQEATSWSVFPEAVEAAWVWLAQHTGELGDKKQQLFRTFSLPEQPLL